MEMLLEISLNMKTCKGIECYGCFDIGQDLKFAVTLFDALEGDKEVSPESVMTIELAKRKNGIPYPIALKHCTLDQLGENVKRITKELFKRINLEGSFNKISN
jgi:hypothetical protein